MKNRQFSRILALVLMLALALSLTACGSSAAPAAEAPATEAPAAEAPAAEAPAEEAAAEIDFPTKTINLFIAAGAGGSMDATIRTGVPFLEDVLGVDIGVNNVSGAGGWVCYADMLNKPADGYNITTYANSNFYGIFNPNVQIDGNVEDWIFLANAVSDPNALYTNKDSEVQTLEQFIDYVTTHTDIVIGTTSIGFDDHLAYLKLASAIPGMLENTSALPSSDISEVIANQLGGFQDFMVANVGDFRNMKDNLNMICVFDYERSPLYPDVPTFNELAEELGIDAEVVNLTHRGYMMKADGADPAVVARLVEAFDEALNNPDYQAKLLETGFVPNVKVGDEAQQLQLDDFEIFKEYIPLFES